MTPDCSWDKGDCGVHMHFNQFSTFYVTSWQDVVANFPDLSTELFAVMLEFTIIEGVVSLALSQLKKEIIALKVLIVDAKLKGLGISEATSTKQAGFTFSLQVRYRLEVLNHDFDDIFNLTSQPNFAAGLQMAFTKARSLDVFGFDVINVEVGPPTTAKETVYEDIVGDMVYFPDDKCDLIIGQVKDVKHTVNLCEESAMGYRKWLCVLPGLFQVFYYNDASCQNASDRVDLVSHGGCTPALTGERHYSYEWTGSCLPVADTTIVQKVMFIVRLLDGWKEKETAWQAEKDAAGTRRLQEATSNTTTNGSDTNTSTAFLPDNFVGDTVGKDILAQVFMKAVPSRPGMEYRVDEMTEVLPPAGFMPDNDFVSYEVTFSVTVQIEYFDEIFDFCKSSEFSEQLRKFAAYTQSDVYVIDFIANWPPGKKVIEQRGNGTTTITDLEEKCVDATILYTMIAIAAIGWLSCCGISILHHKHAQTFNLDRYYADTSPEIRDTMKKQQTMAMGGGNKIQKTTTNHLDSVKVESEEIVPASSDSEFSD